MSTARRFRVVAEWPPIEADDENTAIDWARGTFNYEYPPRITWAVEELPAGKGDETA